MRTQANGHSQVSSSASDAFSVARHFRTGVYLLLAMALITTVVCLFFFQEAAYLAAIPIPVLYGVLAFTDYLAIRSRDTNLRSSRQSEPDREKIEIETVGIVTLLKVAGVLAKPNVMNTISCGSHR